jgi:hypothetical protein
VAVDIDPILLLAALAEVQLDKSATAITSGQKLVRRLREEAVAATSVF